MYLCVICILNVPHVLFVFFTEEERRVRANDREYNEKFQYAVSHT